MSVLKSVLLDTNVVVDLLLERQPFLADAEAIILQVEDGKLKAYLCANSLTTIDYLVSDLLGKAASRVQMKRLLEYFDIAHVNRAVLHEAAHSGMKDFDDAVIVASAASSGVPTIITRNGKDFRDCALQIYSPRQWLASQGL
jgi:predicted nucleic acid-binding protein